ncbi:MAG: hypothetical protein QME73_04490 [Bacillota bacterium]|nr:hypothetical protein [Bacillota bacterium]
MGMEEQLEKRLLKNLRAHRVRGGICSDITGCKSDMWNCLDCRHFIPDIEQIPYFRGQVLAWRNKAEKFKDYPMINTNALRNAELFEKIVKKLIDLDVVLINAKVKLYEKGLHISTGLSSDSLFAEWGCVKGVTCTKNVQALIFVF